MSPRVRQGRPRSALRPTAIEPNVLAFAQGSAIITCGRTRVLCAASLQDSVPPWMEGKGRGWVTAEYAMLPAATPTRSRREVGHLSGRTQEIKRLIGRSLRASVDMDLLGERMIVVDCDVLQADGGTRTASVTGGYVAMALAIGGLINGGLVPAETLRSPVAAVSAGIVGDDLLLDLCYEEDSRAQVDMNVVMNAAGRIVEVQGTAEGQPFAREQMDGLLDLAGDGIRELLALQECALAK